MLGVPCLTVRDNTERPITVEIGSNRLVKHDTQSILDAARDALDACDKPWQVPELWDGHAAERVGGVLKEHLQGGPVGIKAAPSCG